MKNECDKLLTPSEAAKLLGLTPSQLYRLKLKGSGPDWIQVGDRIVRYSSEQISEFKKKKAVNPKTQKQNSPDKLKDMFEELALDYCECGLVSLFPEHYQEIADYLSK